MTLLNQLQSLYTLVYNISINTDIKDPIKLLFHITENKEYITLTEQIQKPDGIPAHVIIEFMSCISTKAMLQGIEDAKSSNYILDKLNRP
jgi:hypothetical protein